jgi:hypothetical protein
MSDFPIEPIPISQLDYRWGKGGPEQDNGAHLRQGVAYHALEKAIPLGESVEPRWERYEIHIVRIVAHIKREGLINPLIVAKVGDMYYTLVGNQRLCVLRILAWDVVPCRVAPRWGGEGIVFDAHPPEYVAWWEDPQMTIGGRPMGKVDLKASVNLISSNRMGGKFKSGGVPPAPAVPGGAVSVKVGDRVSVPHLIDNGVVDAVTKTNLVYVTFPDPPRRVTVRPDQCVLMAQNR